MANKKPRPRAKEKACDRAIQKTLSYGAVFNYPMSKFQLYTFLMTKNKFDEIFFDKSLKRLTKNGTIKAKDGKHFMSGVRPVSWNLRHKYSQELISESRTIIKLLSKIPWIKMIAITGAIAANNASRDDDIDIFIICRKNRIWITRFFVYFFLKVTGKYAHNEDTERKICANIYLDEVKLQWQKDKQSIYTAFEIASMHPVFDRDHTYFKFLKANDWIYNYFGNYATALPESTEKSNRASFLIDKLENIFRKIQLWYMKKNKTSEITTEYLIHFNKHDHSERILNSYKELAEKIS